MGQVIWLTSPSKVAARAFSSISDTLLTPSKIEEALQRHLGRWIQTAGHLYQDISYKSRAFANNRWKFFFEHPVYVQHGCICNMAY